MPFALQFDVKRAGYAEQFVENLKGTSKQMLDEVLVGIKDDIAAHAPKGKGQNPKVGDIPLAESFYEIPAQEVAPSVLEGYIASKVPIKARAQEYGSGMQGPRASSYPITPRTAKLLAFYWENGPRGPMVYHFARVSHPGVYGQFYINETLRIWRPALAQKFGEAIRLAAQAPNIPGGRSF